ncbi:hypothetical protein LCGC14_0728330 [marine sediment metagenome]|uniref:Uncharacterized protein n=1 Tax=marine sediment metagenome TaxID=412755 RepID=A0A0F9THK7_9ZZZZ
MPTGKLPKWSEHWYYFNKIVREMWSFAPNSKHRGGYPSRTRIKKELQAVKLRWGLDRAFIPSNYKYFLHNRDKIRTWKEVGRIMGLSGCTARDYGQKGIRRLLFGI